MGKPDSVCRNEGGGSRGGGETCTPRPEHRHPIYHNSSDTGSTSDGGTADRSTGVMSVVGQG